MPNVSNVQLQIEHTPTQQPPTASRDVAVNYQIGFTQAEVDARASFQVKVSLLSFDNNVLPVTSFNLTAAPGTVARAEKRRSSGDSLTKRLISKSSSTLRVIHIGFHPRCQTRGGQG